ncbi:MAG: phage terminase small subunit P27 family [bacterium]|nr:phage terminase small subunit P27 family [bacterium]
MLKLRGSSLVSRRREESEVHGPEGQPDRPDWLDADAQAAWEELVPMLESMGVLSRIDGHALSRYCRLWSRWRKAEEFLDQKGDMYPLKDESGQVKYFQQWPQVSIAAKLAQQLTRLEQEFGMTPSARARIQIQRSASERPNAKSKYFDAG